MTCKEIEEPCPSLELRNDRDEILIAAFLGSGLCKPWVSQRVLQGCGGAETVGLLPKPTSN